MEKRFSIIVPVYNVEKYLSTCVESILSQTFNNWELILINDGSTDYSGIICDEYKKKDTRIKVFHTENKGVSAARNIGLKNAIGEWFTFIDSDDYVDTNWLELININIKQNEANLYTWGNYYEKNNIEYLSRYIPEDRKYTSSTNFILTGTYRHNAWLYLFSNEWIKKYNCEFPNGIKRSEDQCFLLQYLSHNPTIHSICQPFYHYVKHSESITCSTYTVDDVCDNLRVAVIFAEYAKNYENIDKNFIFYSTTQLFNDFLNYTKDINKSFDPYTQTIYRKYYDRIIQIFPEFTKDAPLKYAYNSIKSAYYRGIIRNTLQNSSIGCIVLNLWHKLHS